MAGYFNYSKSNNAIQAEREGRYPATGCVKVYGFKSTKTVRESLRSTEWHHCSKKYNVVDYYDFPSFLENCSSISELSGWISKFKKNTSGREMVKERILEIIKENMNVFDNFKIIELHREAGYFQNRKRKIQRKFY